MTEERLIPELGDPVSFYNDTEHLRFDKENWKWYREMSDGQMELLDGVTSICHIIDKSFYLMPWACKMMAQKILRTVPRSSDVEGDTLLTRLLPTPWKEFLSLVDAAKTAHKEKLEDAGDVGHAAHSWIEDAIRWAITFNKGVVSEMPALAPIDERAVNCGLGRMGVDESAQCAIPEHRAIHLFAPVRLRRDMRRNRAGGFLRQSCLLRAHLPRRVEHH